jgi:hypothetical protein
MRVQAMLSYPSRWPANHYGRDKRIVRSEDVTMIWPLAQVSRMRGRLRRQTFGRWFNQWYHLIQWRTLAKVQ